jgi:uncharacterized Rmd1/YagE family protein
VTIWFTDRRLTAPGGRFSSAVARVFEVASAQFHLRDWQQSIRRKLETVGDVYDLLVQQAGGRRMEALEISVVVLIAPEIVLALLRYERRSQTVVQRSLDHHEDLPH